MSYSYPYHEKPKGLYKASMIESSCSQCSYFHREGKKEFKCGLGMQGIKRPEKERCRDQMNEESGIPSLD